MSKSYNEALKNYVLVFLHSKSKQPMKYRWQDGAESAESVLEAYEKNGNNVGILLGKYSGLLDVDCDCEETAQLASYFFESPFLEFDRGSADSRHLLFRCEEGGKTIKLLDAEAGSTLVELRGDSAQTMIPPSVHPEGQQLTVRKFDPEAECATYDKLKRQVHLLAVSSLLLRCWVEGSRHVLSLTFAGLCQSSGLSQGEAERIISAVACVADDDALDSRLLNVRSTYLRPAAINAGFQGMTEAIGAVRTKQLAKWLKIISPNSCSGVVPIVAESQDTKYVQPVQAFDPAEITEALLGERLADHLEGNSCYSPESKTWFIWAKVVWRRDSSNQMLHKVVKFLRSLQDSPACPHTIKMRLKKFENTKQIENLLKVAGTYNFISLSDFDVNPKLYACNNGVINLETGDFLQATPEMMLRLFAPVSHDAEALCPNFVKFINGIFEEDNKMVSYVQRAIGYTLTGMTDEQCIFLLNGDGANGKSTLINIMSHLLGSYAVNTPTSTLMASNHRNVGDDLIMLAGARLISASETNEGQCFDEAKIKMLSAGDQMTGRPLYGQFVTFNPVGKIWIATNKLPDIKGQDNGIWRRIRVVPFDRTFAPEEQDRTLGAKLKAELPGILNWAVQGCLEWQRIGLSPPARALEATQAYQEELDTIKNFISDTCEVKEGIFCGVVELYASFEVWCAENFVTKMRKSEFKKSMLKNGFKEGRSSSKRHWEGISPS